MMGLAFRAKPYPIVNHYLMCGDNCLSEINIQLTFPPDILGFVMAVGGVEE